MQNFYERFLPHATAIQVPLHYVHSGLRVKVSHSFNWTPYLHRAFNECKVNLSRAKLLVHPDPTAPLVFDTGSYTSTVDAVLQQRVNNAWQSLAFFSKKLSPTQQI